MQDETVDGIPFRDPGARDTGDGMLAELVAEKVRLEQLVAELSRPGRTAGSGRADEAYPEKG